MRNCCRPAGRRTVVRCWYCTSRPRSWWRIGTPSKKSSKKTKRSQTSNSYALWCINLGNCAIPHSQRGISTTNFHCRKKKTCAVRLPHCCTPSENASRVLVNNAFRTTWHTQHRTHPTHPVITHSCFHAHPYKRITRYKPRRILCQQIFSNVWSTKFWQEK